MARQATTTSLRPCKASLDKVLIHQEVVSSGLPFFLACVKNSFEYSSTLAVVYKTEKHSYAHCTAQKFKPLIDIICTISQSTSVPE